MKQSAKKAQQKTDFKAQLAEYKHQIDDELQKLSIQVSAETNEQFGETPALVVEAFNKILLSGGKRIRGALAIVSYESFGGLDRSVAVRAAAALEIFNTYILVADDIQDRSDTRRGALTVHNQLKQFHDKNHLKGDSYHFGEALAIDSFLVAQHFASNLILDLATEDQIKLRALKNLNNCFMVTAHGQTMDIASEAQELIDLQVVNNILEWKTAYYTFINPLQMGAILAGANEGEVASLTDFGLHTGKLFQITDDIIGTFGDSGKTGKGVMDDIKEGKRTLLIYNALKLARQTDAYFLQDHLGNQTITKAEFEKCQKIIKDCGALEATKIAANKSAKSALETLESLELPTKAKDFLKNLIEYLQTRQS